MDTHCPSRFEVSRAFAKAHARVVMINRKEEQGDEAIRKIKGVSSSLRA